METLSQDGQTLALHLAVRNKDMIALQHVIRSGGNVNAVDERGRTVLHIAASTGHVEITRVLLESGADVNIRVVQDIWLCEALSFHHGHEYEHPRPLTIETSAYLHSLHLDFFRSQVQTMLCDDLYPLH